jgi:hypothetical protein
MMFAVRRTQASQMPLVTAPRPWKPWFGHLGLLHCPHMTVAHSRQSRDSHASPDHDSEQAEHVHTVTSGAFRILAGTTAAP